MDANSTMRLPRYVTTASLASGATGYYFYIPKIYRDQGCIIPGEALGIDYDAACIRANALNAALDEWIKIKKQKPTLDAARLREILHYDPDSGVWTWRQARRGGYIAAGSKAGSHNNEGYLQLFVDGVRYKAHRLAWLYMTGEWPPCRIDHADVDKSNCRWQNLRLATHSQNLANTKVRPDNKLGIKGVYRTRSGRYAASIKLGTFDTPEGASAAYRKAAIAVFGEFARVA